MTSISPKELAAALYCATNSGNAIEQSEWDSIAQMIMDQFMVLPRETDTAMEKAMALSKEELARRLIEAEQMLEAERIVKAELFKELEEANERAWR